MSSLLTLPTRLGVQVLGATLKGGVKVTAKSLALAVDVLGLVRNRQSTPEPRPDSKPGPVMNNRPAREAPNRPAPEAFKRPAPPAPSRRAPAAPERPDLPPASRPAPPEPPQPAHVSEEPVLVEEFADAGAQDGAGAQVRVAEPWDGYAQMRAADVIDRVRAASSAELAAIQLYERGHRDRETVISAVKRALRNQS
ncbi:MAG: hypothetical protein ACYC91_17425 [Solirubrobacteraceae bacterium]